MSIVQSPSPGIDFSRQTFPKSVCFQIQEGQYFGTYMLPEAEIFRIHSFLTIYLFSSTPAPGTGAREPKTEVSETTKYVASRAGVTLESRSQGEVNITQSYLYISPFHIYNITPPEAKSIRIVSEKCQEGFITSNHFLGSHDTSASLIQ